MAAASDSQGLKIAVAAFVSLTVILAVSAYFLYSNLSTANAQLTAAQEKERTAQKGLSDALADRDEMRKLVGSRAEDFDAAKLEIKNEQKKLDDKVAAIPKKVDDAVAKAQAAGAAGPELQEIRDTIKRLVQEYQTEVNKNYISSLARLTDIFENLDLLDAALGNNYTMLKRTLESANTVNKTQTDAVMKQLATAKADLLAEQESHKKLREELLNKTDLLTTEVSKLQTELANLNTRYTQLKDDSDKKLALDQQMIREYRDQIERDENVLDVPDGKVTYVDNLRGELHTNITSAMGARPQMVMSIFDRNSPGIPTEKPKGTIELIQVGDRYSIARILQTTNPTDPVRAGDLVHSTAWSPNEPKRFALIGKIDVNRDGKDDREDLKRMIRLSGGIVDYDLPPPGAGKESGKLTARDSWYVVDDRKPFREYYGQTNENTPESAEFQKKMTEALREARLNGVRPIKIERLLAYLGYQFAAPVLGRAEAFDANSVKNLLRPRQAEGQPKAAAPAEGAEQPKAEKSEEMPKEEKEKAEKPEKPEAAAPK